MVHKKEKVHRECVVCGSEFMVHESRLKTKNGATCCSVTCSVESRRRTLSSGSPRIKCEACGVEFSVKASRLLRRPVRFCGSDCARLATVTLESLRVRFLSRVNTNGPVVRQEIGRCHQWTGCTVNGYGAFSVRGQQVRAHRFAWLLKFGSLPSDNACHVCDNKICVNADHLFDGDNSANQADKIAKNRQSRGECHGMSKLSSTDVQRIRALLAVGNKHRDIADQFKVSKNAVSSIASGRTWSHLAPDSGKLVTD